MNHTVRKIIALPFLFLLMSHTGSLLACDKMVCFGSEPSGEWVTIAVQPSYECGNGAVPNQSCVDYVGNRAIGSEITVCRRSNIPNDWNLKRSTISASCGVSE